MRILFIIFWQEQSFLILFLIWTYPIPRLVFKKRLNISFCFRLLLIVNYKLMVFLVSFKKLQFNDLVTWKNLSRKTRCSFYNWYQYNEYRVLNQFITRAHRELLAERDPVLHVAPQFFAHG